MDLPLYTTVSRTELSDLVSANYHQSDCAIALKQVIRQSGHGNDQKLLYPKHLRNCEITVDDWKVLMKSPANVEDAIQFEEALRLFSTAMAVAEYNNKKLLANAQAVAAIEAIHSGPGASKTSADDAGGLEPMVHLAHEA